MKSALIVALALQLMVTGVLCTDPEWNGLRASFPRFESLPRTRADAVTQGWELDTSAGSCDHEGTKFNGYRYMKSGDPGAMLLFDKNGYIAGIQAGIPKTRTSTYPGLQNEKYKVFNEEEKWWVITAYFIEPEIICTTGRSKEEFETQGTGTILAVQNGTTANDLIRILLDETELQAKTEFGDGKCFPAMGQHYYYDIDENMSCDDNLPVFPMYHDNRLTGFGWAFNVNFNNSNRWEHANKAILRKTMAFVPKCLAKDEPITTLHVYLIDNPRTISCRKSPEVGRRP